MLESELEKLHSERPEVVEEGVRALTAHLEERPQAEFRAVVEALCALFYVDTHDRPDLEPCLDVAVEGLAAAGVHVVPHLLDLMKGSDIKCHFYLARTLGRIGGPALPALRRFIATEQDPYGRSFALFALGKVRDPAAVEAFPEVVGSLMHPDREVRDSAARTLGKLAEVVPPERLTQRHRAEAFEALFRTLGDVQPAVRAKAVRSLGKMTRAGYLTTEQEERLTIAVRHILGEDEAHEWDRAYVVRREAQETMRHLVARAAVRPR